MSWVASKTEVSLLLSHNCSFVLILLDYVTTPPLPSSSPAPLIEYMELSPLPHKTPFSLQLQSQSASPTPNSFSGDEDMMLDSPAPIARPSLDFPKPPSFAEYVLCRLAV